jgi:ADP-ribose pyrophosphatase YjhB (NUDIX family)
MKFCSECGKPVQLGVPAGESRPRYVCSACGIIHYQNPKMIVGCIPAYGDQVLLCRRSIEPAQGKWTLPSGFMENGETVEEGALREVQEEACARVTIRRLHSVYSIAHIDQVYLLFLGELDAPTFDAGEESSEVRLFREDEIRWDEIAFHAVRFALRGYFDDRRTGKVAVHFGSYATDAS